MSEKTLPSFPPNTWIADYINASRMVRRAQPGSQQWSVGWVKIGQLVAIALYTITDHDNTRHKLPPAGGTE